MFPFPNLNTLGKNESVANAERIFISLKAQNFSFQSFLYSFKEDKETGKTWRTDIVPFALVTEWGYSWVFSSGHSWRGCLLVPQSLDRNTLHVTLTKKIIKFLTLFLKNKKRHENNSKTSNSNVFCSEKVEMWWIPLFTHWWHGMVLGWAWAVTVSQVWDFTGFMFVKGPVGTSQAGSIHLWRELKAGEALLVMQLSYPISAWVGLTGYRRYIIYRQKLHN